MMASRSQSFTLRLASSNLCVIHYGVSVNVLIILGQQEIFDSEAQPAGLITIRNLREHGCCVANNAAERRQTR
jgi:hypothetical protein